MHAPATALLAALLLLAGDGNVLLTRKGEKFEGTVSREGADYVVQTVTGPRRIPEADVALVFDNLREVLQKADDRFREAKRLFEEAKAMDEANPVRNQKLSLAVEIAQGSVATYQLLQPHYGNSSGGVIPSTIQVMMQFIRICRGAATSDVSVAGGAGKSGVVALDDAVFAFTPPPRTDRAWALADELGPGLVAAAQDLGHPDATRRLEAVRRLTHPPSALHLPALLKLLEAEKDPAVLQALSEGLAFMDSGALLKSLGWVKKEPDAARRALVFSIVRAAGDRPAFDFLLDWFEDAPTRPCSRAAARRRRRLTASACTSSGNSPASRSRT